MAPWALLLIVLAADALVGGLPVVRPLLGLPLNLIRRLTRWFDTRLNRENRGPGARRIRGLVVVVAVIFLAWGVGAASGAVFGRMAYGWMLEAISVLVLLHQRECLDRMRRVSRSVVNGDIETARTAAAPLVRHDTATVDEFALARAAIEGGTMRFSGRLVGTVFWYLLLGLPGLCIYRANSAVADVIGRRSPRHADFGFVSARLDAVLSLIPALLAGPLLALSALFVSGTSPVAAVRGWLRDLADRGFRADYRAEGAMAGALGIALGGPRPFDGGTLPGKWIGDGRARATAGDINRAVFLIVVACLFIGIGLGLAILARAG